MLQENRVHWLIALNVARLSVVHDGRRLAIQSPLPCVVRQHPRLERLVVSRKNQLGFELIRAG